MACWLKELSMVNAPAELPRITLTRAKDGKSFKGPGSVTRESDGRLRLKLYSAADFKDAFGLMDLPSGTIVPRQDLFDLDAADMHGYSWRAEGIWPHCSMSLPTGMAVISGNVNLLIGTRPPTRVKKSYLSLAIHTSAKFPANQLERIDRRIGDQLLSASNSRNAAELEVDGLQFRLFRDGELLRVQVAGEWYPGDAEELSLQVVAALQFMLGRRLQADVITLASGDAQTQIVQSVVRERADSRIEPPREWRSQADEGITWETFKAFLGHVRVAPGGNAKELRRWTAEVIDTGNAPLEVSSLVLCVAVEGVVGLLQGKESTDAGLAADIKRALKVASGAEFPAGLKPRIIGAIKSMKRLRARDYLESLVRQNGIPAAQVAAWNALRNSSAHADATEDEWVVPTMERSAVVLALYYRLVFMLIGYRGVYTDYSEIGWPERSLSQ